MKTLREMMDLIESAQAPVAEGKNNIDNKIIHLMTNGIPAEEIARKLDIPVEWVHEVAKYNMPDSAIDYNDPRNSTQGRERFGEQGVAEAQKTDNRPASQFDREIVKAQPDGSCELKCGHKTSAKLSKNPVGKKIFCARCYELRNKKEGMAEGSTVAYEVEWIDKNTGEQGLTTVSALTSQDAADKLVKMKLQQLDNVDVTDVFPAHKQTTDKEQSVDEQATPEAIARIEQLNSK